MAKYKQILLASDLSAQSEYIAERAEKMAKDSNAKLSVIYVMEHSPVAYGGEYSIPIDFNLEETLEKQARESLSKLGEKFNIKPKDRHLESGSIKLAVIDTATEINADLIVVGTHGHHGLDVLLGSRANAILHNAKCDVLVVRVKE